jgi:hypothetical protein
MHVMPQPAQVSAVLPVAPRPAIVLLPARDLLVGHLVAHGCCPVPPAAKYLSSSPGVRAIYSNGWAAIVLGVSAFDNAVYAC